MIQQVTSRWECNPRVLMVSYLLLTYCQTNEIKTEIENEFLSLWVYFSKKCNVTLCRIIENKSVLFQKVLKEIAISSEIVEF